MENGNEKPNPGLTNEAGLNGSKHQETWRIVCGSDQRFFFVNSENDDSQWIPPADLWSSKLGLPYGWEAGISGNNIKYYINHVEKTTTLEDPRSEADQAIQLRMAAQRSRKVQINRDPAMGFGFVAGSEKPVVIRSVIPGKSKWVCKWRAIAIIVFIPPHLRTNLKDGPSNGKLYSNDQILRVNGEDVSDVPQERVINLIKSCIDSLEMDVVSSEDLQDAKNQGQRRSSLMSRATRERRRSSPVNVRFADDIVQYIGPAEQARRSSLPVIPNVLKVYLENGQTRSFHYSQKTTVQEIFTSLGQKIGIKSMQYFSLVLSGPQKNQMSLIQNHEKVADVYLNRNCSRSSWVCKLRLCFLPRNPIDLFDEDPIVFNYLYDQTSKDIVEGHYGSDLRYDLAIKLAALHMQQKAIHSKNKMPTKLSVKMIEKDFDGLDHFIPEDIIRGVKMKDLRKVLDQQIKFNQSLATIGQRYLSSAECKKQYLKEAKDLMSYGGKYFKVILYSYDQLTNGTSKNDSKKPNQQDATLLVSPRYGLSQMVKGEVNVLCQVADLEQITEFAIAYHTEGKRLLTISSKESKDTILVMKPLDSMDLVTFIIGYQKLWNKPTAKLKIMGDTQEPLAPLTDGDIPPYASTHRIIPDSWSYPSFLQVPGNNSNHNFFVDLSKPPAVNGKQNGEDENTSPLKRSSEDLTASESTAFSDVPEKKAKNKDSISVGSSNNDEQSRALYAITEEGYLSNNDEDNDLITQLTFAEEMYKGDHTTSKTPSQSSEPENKADSHSSIEKNDKIGSELDEKEVYSNKMAVDHNDIDILGTELLLEDEDRNGLEVQDANEDKPSNAEMLVNADDDQFEQPIKDDFLDINDIDIDDRGSDGPASDDMHSSLADFSFAGEMFTPDLRSSTESLTMDDDIVSSVAMRNKTTDDSGESEKISVDHDRNQSPRNNDVDIPTSGGTTLNPVTSNDITIENKKYFSKRLHVDELDCKLEHGKVEHDKMDGKQQKMVVYDIDLDDTDYNEDEETGIKLLSFTQFDDTESKETNSEQGEDSKDSDISSLTSRESTTADSHEDDKEDSCSNEQMDGNEKQNSRTEMSEFSSTNTSKVVASTKNQGSENSKGLDQIDNASMPYNSEHIANNPSNVMLDLSVTDSEWPKISSKSSSSDTLILGIEPGESDDTPFVIAEESSSQEIAFANYQDISLMDWIIPPPPGSTRELQESDITVASPPPLSPDPISSPPVELAGFDELEIDGLVVPPPPLGPSLDELIKIVSPPPDKQTTYNKIWDGPVIQSNVTKEIDTNTKEFERLSLNDGQQNDLTFPEGNSRRRIHSSESSSSQAFDFDSDSANYYSESMVSCYSLSNDSQRTSEDELFEETKVVLSEKVEKPFMQTVIGDLQDSRPGITTEDEKRIDESKVGNKGKLSNQSLIDRTLIQKPGRKPVTSQDDQLPSNDILSFYTLQQATHLTNGLPFDDYDCFDDVVVNNDSFPHSVMRKDDAGHTKGVNTKQIELKQEHIQESGNNLQQSIPAAKPKLSNPTMNVILADEEYSDKDHDSVTSSTFPDYLLQQSDTAVKITPSYDDDNESFENLRLTPSKKPLSCNPTLRAVLQEEGSSDNESLVSTGFPGYLLQQSNEKALEKRDSAPRSDSSSIEFETESRNDKEVTSVPTKTTTKRNAKLNMDNDNLGEDDRSDNTSPKSHKSKLETKDLTERLKLRIQGCVEDCKQAVIKSSYSYSNNSKWKEAVQENASSFASDIRQLNLNVQEMNPDIQPSVKSSQETLQSLVGSFVMASSTKSRISIYSIRILAGILDDVICLYDDIIDRTEEAVRLFPAREKCKDISEKTSAMNTLIGSLGRTLKRL